MMGKYIVENFDANSGVFKTQQTKLFQEIADYANKKSLKIIEVSEMDDKGRCAVIFEELK